MGTLCVGEYVSDGDSAVNVMLSSAVSDVESDRVVVMVIEGDRVKESVSVSAYVREKVNDGELEGVSEAVSVDVFDTCTSETVVVKDWDLVHVIESVSEKDKVRVTVSEIVAFVELRCWVRPVSERVAVGVTVRDRLSDGETVWLSVGDRLPVGEAENVEDPPVNVLYWDSVRENVHVSV